MRENIYKLMITLKQPIIVIRLIANHKRRTLVIPSSIAKKKKNLPKNPSFAYNQPQKLVANIYRKDFISSPSLMSYSRVKKTLPWTQTNTTNNTLLKAHLNTLEINSKTIITKTKQNLRRN